MLTYGRFVTVIELLYSPPNRLSRLRDVSSDVGARELTD